jgi:hypothetical protein
MDSRQRGYLKEDKFIEALKVYFISGCSNCPLNLSHNQMVGMHEVASKSSMKRLISSFHDGHGGGFTFFLSTFLYLFRERRSGAVQTFCRFCSKARSFFEQVGIPKSLYSYEILLILLSLETEVPGSVAQKVLKTETH